MTSRPAPATPRAAAPGAGEPTAQQPTAPLPGVILAGGRARRMGGGDKGLLEIAGRSLIARVAERLGPDCAPLALNANGDPARFAACGLPVLPDSLPGGVDAHPGPLGGVLAAMTWAAGLGAASVVTAPADTPFLPLDLVARLRIAAQPSGLAVAATRSTEGLRPQPIAALWPVELRDTLGAALQAGERTVMRWAEAQGAVHAVFDEPDAFFNVNTPQDLDAARDRLA